MFERQFKYQDKASFSYASFPSITDASAVTASHVTPSTLPSSDHHSAPPWGPTNFGWTFNPQNEIATFRRLPNSAPSPSHKPLMYNRLLPSETLAEVTDLPNAAPAYIRSL
eukprot:jgi/Psemu1/27963/gm1.27963_g